MEILFTFLYYHYPSYHIAPKLKEDKTTKPSADPVAGRHKPLLLKGKISVSRAWFLSYPPGSCLPHSPNQVWQWKRSHHPLHCCSGTLRWMHTTEMEWTLSFVSPAFYPHILTRLPGFLCIYKSFYPLFHYLVVPHHFVFFLEFPAFSFLSSRHSQVSLVRFGPPSFSSFP